MERTIEWQSCEEGVPEKLLSLKFSTNCCGSRKRAVNEKKKQVFLSSLNHTNKSSRNSLNTSSRDFSSSRSTGLLQISAALWSAATFALASAAAFASSDWLSFVSDSELLLELLSWRRSFLRFFFFFFFASPRRLFFRFVSSFFLCV